MGVKILTGLGMLTPTQFYDFEIRNVVTCQRRTQIILGDIFSSIVFSITTLFYQSQQHIPQYVRNIGWGWRYRGLGILTPTPDFCFWNNKNFSYVSKNNYFAKLFWFYNCSSEDFRTSEAQVWVGSRYPGHSILIPTMYSWHTVRLVTKTVWKMQISKEQLLC